ncbi:odorant-binding protein-like [Dama dama]|uniref:odorant-binding protein-like n=1 Tax=Dama dama TaxID=30532 RepID=UPI002A35AE9C|nr:odorant-binding protein-like [Dama dama]
MKVLFLTLVLGLVCSCQQRPAGPHHSQLSGEWKTHYIASNNPEKTSENGPFNVYLRSINFNDKGDSLVFHFFLKHNGECIETSVTGTQIGNNVYTADYAGINRFYFILVSNDGLIVISENKDEAGKTSRLIGLLGKEDVNDHNLERFKEEIRKFGIPEENIVDFTKGDWLVDERRAALVKDPTIHTSWGKFHTDPHLHHKMWSSEVHQDSDIGSATSSCTLDSLLPEAHPCQPSQS